MSRDDKETVGDSMLMDDKQKEFLSALETGQAVVFTEGLSKPVHIAIKRITDTNEAEISDELVRSNFLHYIEKNKKLKKLYIKDEIIKTFYEKYDSVLIKFAKEYLNNSMIYSENEFIEEINSFSSNFGNSMEDILHTLAEEKTKLLLLGNDYTERLYTFSKNYFLDKKIKGGLDDIKLANMVKFLKAI